MVSLILSAANVKQAPASTIGWRWEQWKFGADLHRAGEQMTRCTNDEQVRGYLDALKAAADAETYAYLQRIR